MQYYNKYQEDIIIYSNYNIDNIIININLL